MEDRINPKHYKHGKMETINAIEGQLTPEEFEGFCKGIMLKYICRAKYKNGIEDYRKAEWYLKRLIRYKEKQEGKNHANS